MNNSTTGSPGDNREFDAEGNVIRPKSDLYQVGASWYAKLPGKPTLEMIKITDVTDFTVAFLFFHQIHNQNLKANSEASARSRFEQAIDREIEEARNSMWNRYKKEDVELVEPIEK